MREKQFEWLIPILLAAGAAAALWYYWWQSRPAEPVPAAAAPAAVVAEPAARVDPVHPVVTDESTPAEKPALVPLPALDESDEYFELAIADLFDESLTELLVETGLIGKIVATVDNLPRSHVAERVRPLNRLEGEFTADEQDNSGQATISELNYLRYDALVNVVTSADLNAVAEVYRRFYPLFQKAYVDLGYPDGYFNDRLVEVLDHLLATPDVEGPLALVRPHVLYEYADPELESLSSGQKLMLRMGRNHRARMKQTLRQVRAIVTSL